VIGTVRVTRTKASHTIRVQKGNAARGGIKVVSLSKKW